MKKAILVLICFFVLVAFMGCNQNQEERHGNSGRSISLVDPVPTKGEKVATVDGKDYYYDKEYIFKLGDFYQSVELSKKPVRFIMYIELYALEAKSLGLIFTPKEYEYAYNGWKGMDESYSQTISAIENTLKDKNNGLKPKEIIEEQITLKGYKKLNTSYEETLRNILKTENITEDEFWAQESPYIEKGLYAAAYIDKMYKEFDEKLKENPDADYAKLTEEKMQQLMKKYKVKLMKEY